MRKQVIKYSGNIFKILHRELEFSTRKQFLEHLNNKGIKISFRIYTKMENQGNYMLDTLMRICEFTHLNTFDLFYIEGEKQPQTISPRDPNCRKLVWKPDRFIHDCRYLWGTDERIRKELKIGPTLFRRMKKGDITVAKSLTVDQWVNFLNKLDNADMSNYLYYANQETRTRLDYERKILELQENILTLKEEVENLRQWKK